MNQFRNGTKKLFETPTANVYMHAFSHPDEHKEYLEMLKLGSKFDMRPRAMFNFYGADLVAYKRKYPASRQVNEFLRIFSAFLTTQLEDDCPGSWEECGLEFWEELLTVCIPRYIKVTNKQKEIRTLVEQLERFVRWLDKRIESSFHDTVQSCIKDNMSALKICEAVLNDLFKNTYPQLFNNESFSEEELNKVTEDLEKCSSTVDSIFEVSQPSDSIISLYDLQTTKTYQVINFPTKKLSPGILIDGVIGKTRDDIYWTWHFTESVYPNKAQKYIKFVD